MAKSSKLSVTTQDAEVSKFNSGNGLRCFCTNCGSPLWFESLDFPEMVAIPLGVLDGGDIPQPAMRLWVGSNPAWCVISDDLPQHAGNPP